MTVFIRTIQRVPPFLTDVHVEAEKDGQTLTCYGKDCATKAICDDGCKVLESQGFNVKTCDF